MDTDKTLRLGLGQTAEKAFSSEFRLSVSICVHPWLTSFGCGDSSGEFNLNRWETTKQTKITKEKTPAQVGSERILSSVSCISWLTSLGCGESPGELTCGSRHFGLVDGVESI